MKIIINKYSVLSASALSNELLSRAKFRLRIFKFGTNEALLNNFFKEKYKMSLRQACLKIFKSIKILGNMDDDSLIVVFENKKDDDIASIITYGTGKVPGSKILKFMFESPGRKENN